MFHVPCTCLFTHVEWLAWTNVEKNKYIISILHKCIFPILFSVFFFCFVWCSLVCIVRSAVRNIGHGSNNRNVKTSIKRQRNPYSTEHVIEHHQRHNNNNNRQFVILMRRYNRLTLFIQMLSVPFTAVALTLIKPFKSENETCLFAKTDEQIANYKIIFFVQNIGNHCVIYSFKNYSDVIVNSHHCVMIECIIT